MDACSGDAEAGTVAVSTPLPVDAHDPPDTLDDTHLTVYEVTGGLPRLEGAAKSTCTVPTDGDVATTFWGAVGGELATVTWDDGAEHALPASA